MGRKGHYPGGGTIVGPNTPGYFTRGSITATPDDHRPDRLPTAGTVRHAAPNQQSELIKAGDARVKKNRPKKWGRPASISNRSTGPLYPNSRAPQPNTKRVLISRSWIGVSP